MSAWDHLHTRDCASRSMDDLFRGECDCLAEDECGDPDCSECGPNAGFDDDDEAEYHRQREASG